MLTSHTSAFGDLLRRHRLAAGLTQEALAERAGVSVRAVSDLERAVKTRPHRDTVRLLADALGLTSRDRAVFDALARHNGDKLPMSAMSLLPAPAVSLPLVGRDRELALMERHLAGEGAPLLLLAGEPGIGKSRLLREAARRAGAQGLHVLAAGCQRHGGQESYAPLLQALDSHIHAQSSAQSRTSLRGCAWLVRLLPELANGPIEPLPGWTLPPAQERRLLFHAVGQYLANVSGPSGTLLVLDDLHWAGADALDLLVTLMRATPMPLRALGAYRDTEVGVPHALSAMLADLAQAGLARRHRLEPLAPPDAAHLLDSLLADVEGMRALRGRVLQRTGGVPFFLVSCAQALHTHTSDSLPPDAVPWDVAQSVRQRIAALPADAQAVLQVAAVIGRQVDPTLLCAVEALPEADVLASLEAASRARLLIDESADNLHFAHDIIREVVEGDVSAHRRALLHRRIAEGLERQPAPAPVEQLAYHYARSPDQERAALYLERAGDRARARSANVEADEYYGALVDRLDHLGRPLDAARVREKSGGVRLTLAHYDAALQTLERAAEAYLLMGDMDGLVRTVAQIGHVYARSGKPGEGLDRLQHVLDLVEATGLASDGPQHSLTLLYMTLAELFFVTGRASEQITAAGRAIMLARTVDDDRLLAEAQVWHGMALCIVGRLAEGIQLMTAAIEVTERTGDALTLAWALHVVAHAYFLIGDLVRSRLAVERAIPAAAQVGDPMWLMHDLAHGGFIAFHAGDWRRAGADGERAVALQREVGVSWSSPYPLSCLGELRFAEGRWGEAIPYLEESSAIARSTGDKQALRLPQRVLAELDLLDGRPEAALARLAPLCEPSGHDTWDVKRLLPDLTVAHLHMGNAPAAMETAVRAIEGARATGERLTLIDALRVRAMIALRQGRWPDSERDIAEGLELARRIGYLYGEARLLRLCADLYTHTGESDLARARLAEALAIFQRLGARRDAEEGEQTLADLQRF